MLATFALAPFNHLLRSESWASKRLRPYAGKTVRFCILPFLDINLTVHASGELLAAMSCATIDTTITLDLGLLPCLLIGER